MPGSTKWSFVRPSADIPPVELLKVMTPDFTPLHLWIKYVLLNMWQFPLNPVDYKIWGLLQERVYKTSIKDVDELRRRIAEEWDKLDQRIIDIAVAEWRKRLRACSACVVACGQFEYKMWPFIISDILYRNFLSQLFEILLSCSVKTDYFLEYNACYVLHFVTALLYYATQWIFIKYAIANHIPWKQIS